MKYLLVLLFISSPLFALKIDPNSSSFEMREKKERVDVFDFSGEYPQLEKIDIDGKKKRVVEFILDGSYPLLTQINYTGGFGSFKGDLTGSFPVLEKVTLACSKAVMEIDLQGQWSKKCEIYLASQGDLRVLLPKDIPLLIHTKCAPGGKVIPGELKRKSFGWLSKTYVRGDEPLLIINCETKAGSIFLEE